MLAKYYDGIEIHREEKIVYVKFLSPHRVISTDRIAGGLSDELEYLYNHQSCEPSGHYHGHELAVSNPVEYKRLICERYGLPPEKCACDVVRCSEKSRLASLCHILTPQS